MTELSDPSGASLRLSNDERERAAVALQAHAAAGRLDDAELRSRVAAARAAVIRGDLAPLFADLPGALRCDDRTASTEQSGAVPASPSSVHLPEADAPPPGSPVGSSRLRDGDYGDDRDRQRSRWGLLVVSVMPFIAVVLFFVTSGVWGFQYSWLWFLLIPFTGALVYGLDGPRRRR